MGLSRSTLSEEQSNTRISRSRVSVPRPRWSGAPHFPAPGRPWLRRRGLAPGAGSGYRRESRAHRFPRAANHEAPQPGASTDEHAGGTSQECDLCADKRRHCPPSIQRYLAGLPLCMPRTRVTSTMVRGIRRHGWDSLTGGGRSPRGQIGSFAVSSRFIPVPAYRLGSMVPRMVHVPTIARTHCLNTASLPNAPVPQYSRSTVRGGRRARSRDGSADDRPAPGSC